MSEIDRNIALAISGGGYRSTLFALGSLWRLNEFGLLSKINRITSVSGGSIVSAYLAMRWKDLRINSDTGVAENFKTMIAEPIQEFCSKSLDVIAVLRGFLQIYKTMGDKVADMYAKRLYGSKTLQDIPTPGEGPEFIFYAASLQTGDGVRISKEYIGDYKIGKLPNPPFSLAKVVGASSAFPPFFSPVIIKCDPEGWEEKDDRTYICSEKKYRGKLILTDGGVYDNMGLEAVWNDGFKTVFVCDAGAPWKDQTNIGKNWFSQIMSVYSTTSRQVGDLRKRTLIDNFKEIDEEGNHIKYGGTYWGISTKIKNYKLKDSMVEDNERTKSIKYTRTRLNSFSAEEQGNLINWGYALTDTALRTHYFKEKKEKGTWPIPQYGLYIYK
jgi:NTE family protein